MINRSLTHLILRSVIVTWLVVFVSIFIYASTRTLTDERARDLGLPLIYKLIDDEAPRDRARRLQEIKRNYALDAALISPREAKERSGRVIAAGHRYPHKVSNREHWLYMALTDGSGVLAMGPIDLLVPRGLTPVGFYIAVVIVPCLAFLWIYRVERELTKVERASQAIASGVLDTRVDNHDGPSRELAASFNEMAERVEHLIKSRDELIQAISHEFGSPLARLRLHLSLLEESGERDREHRYQGMRRELDELEELVAELLSYIQSDEREMTLELFDPQKMLEDLVELASLELSLESPIVIELAPISAAHVYADKRLFQRAIENLLRNATRHARRRVFIELYRDDHSVIASVHDDGPGIPEDQRERALTPFVRLETTQRDESSGIGLGLSIVAQIMKRHKGVMKLDTSHLGGLSVTLRWRARDS